jgi:hypothetical protein
MEAAKTKAQSLIDENAVMVFSKSYCPYCRASKKTLQSAGAQFKVYELNEESQCNHPTTPSPSCISLEICDTPWSYRGEAGHNQRSSRRRRNADDGGLLKRNRRRQRHPGRPRGALRPAHRPQHLLRQEAHRWELGPGRAGLQPQSEAAGGRRSCVRAIHPCFWRDYKDKTPNIMRL